VQNTVNERVDERVNERVNERVDEWVDEWVNERVNESNFTENQCLTVIDLAFVIFNCNKFSFMIAFVILKKESIILQRIEIRFLNASKKRSKSVSRSNCVAN